MKESTRAYVLGMSIGGFFGAIVGMFFVGIVLGVRIGAYVHTKLDDRGQIVPRTSQQCNINGGFK